MRCLHFVNSNEDNQMLTRLKVYNKVVHLLTAGQFKKKVNTELKKIMYPSTSFFQDKILPAKNHGLSRIEVS